MLTTSDASAPSSTSAAGTGALLRSILARHPALRGVLFDQPHVVERAEVPKRCEVAAGSFFESVPEGGDAYVLKMIIHDWGDEESIAILGNIRAAMPAHGLVLVIERDLGAPNGDAPAKFSDLNMLVGPGGRERTDDEYASLFPAAGLIHAGSTPTAAGMSLYEARVHA